MIQVTKKISLEKVGEDWKDCYLEFRIPSIKEVRVITEKKDEPEVGLDLIGNLFIGGKGLDEAGKVVDIKKEDIEDLPITLVNEAFKELVEVSPN